MENEEEGEEMNFYELINNRKSIRKYKSKDIPKEVLNKILLAGVRAPSSGNMQVYSIVVTTKKDLKTQLFNAHFEQDMILQAPVILTFCADFNRMRKWLSLRDATDNFNDVFGFLIGAIDAALVAQNVVMASEVEGLGSCYLGTTLGNARKIGEMLNLPKGVYPVTSLVLGYPDEDIAPRDRLPLDGVVHHETYQDYSNDKITEVYKEKETSGWQRYLSIPELKLKIEKSGVQNLAQVYTTLKYTNKLHKDTSKMILEYLKEQDFFEID